MSYSAWNRSLRAKQTLLLYTLGHIKVNLHLSVRSVRHRIGSEFDQRAIEFQQKSKRLQNLWCPSVRHSQGTQHNNLFTPCILILLNYAVEFEVHGDIPATSIMTIAFAANSEHAIKRDEYHCNRHLIFAGSSAINNLQVQLTMSLGKIQLEDGQLLSCLGLYVVYTII